MLNDFRPSCLVNAVEVLAGDMGAASPAVHAKAPEFLRDTVGPGSLIGPERCHAGLPHLFQKWVDVGVPVEFTGLQLACRRLEEVRVGGAT